MNNEKYEDFRDSKKFMLAKLHESVLNANERLNFQHDDYFLNFNQKISPNAKEIQQLERRIEILELQKDIIKIYSNGMKNTVLLTLYYQEKIRETKEKVFIINYKTLLNSRDAIFLDDKVLKLDEDLKLAELKRFEKYLDEEELPKYKQCPIPKNLEEVEEINSQIECEIQICFKKLEEFRNNNEIAYDLFQDKVELINTVQETFQNELLEFANNSYNIDEISIIIKESDLSMLKQRLMTEKNKKKFLIETCPEALHIACEAGNFEIVKYLIEEMKFDSKVLCKDGYFPINYAAKNLKTTCTDILNYLYIIDKKIIEPKAIYGRTPLHTATYFDNFTAAEWLIKNNANVNQSETGNFQKETPLHNAAYNGNTLMVELLLDKGANPYATNSKEITPLIHAINKGHYYVVQIFWSRGYWITDTQLNLLMKYPLEENQRQCLELPLLRFLERIKSC